MWAMNWFPDRRYEIQLSDDKDAKDVFKLAFYGDYNKTTALQPVMARYKDVFLSFNRKKDMNIETKEYADMLLIVQEFPGEYHSHTNLEEALAVGDGPYQMKVNDKDKLFFEVCSFAAGNYYVPDLLTVAVGRKQNDLCKREDNKAMNKGDPAWFPSDCDEVRPWVELNNPAYPSGVQIELCDSIANDPDQYCSQIDDLSRSEVWNICRLECPQSGCVGTPGQGTANANGEAHSGKCTNRFSAVRVEVLDSLGESQMETKGCHQLTVGFQSDLEYVCNQLDSFTRMPVRDICQIQCPGTGCED